MSLILWTHVVFPQSFIEVFSYLELGTFLAPRLIYLEKFAELFIYEFMATNEGDRSIVTSIFRYSVEQT
jgi:hypothetical protein